MSLARVKVWIPGDVLTAADLNGEFNNVINNPITLISPSTGVINFNLQPHVNLVPSAITASSGVIGNTLNVSTSGGLVYAPVPSAPRVQGLQGAISSQSGSFSALQYVLQTTAFQPAYIVNTTASFTVSIGTAGPAAGGRDVAGAFASTYVHWYAISTGLNSTSIAGIVSSQPPPTGPVLPAGYQAWTYLGGSIYSSASTTVTTPHHFYGANAAYDASVVPVNPASTVEVTTATASYIPVNALSASYRLEGTVTTNAGGVAGGLLKIKVASSQDLVNLRVDVPAASANNTNDTYIELPNVSIFTNWAYQTASSNAAALTGAVQAVGYVVPNGGE